METINKPRLQYYIFILLFLSLNILATFIITTEALNRYIIAFDYTLGGILNSIIGNAFILLIIVFFRLQYQENQIKIPSYYIYKCGFVLISLIGIMEPLHLKL